jgi:excisionase family DNA binding protein
MNSSQLTTVLTIDDLAEYLKISKSTLYKLAQDGLLPGQKIGRHWRFHRQAVDEWLRIEPSGGKKNQKASKPR